MKILLTTLYIQLFLFTGIWADSDEEVEDRRGFGSSGRGGKFDPNHEMTFVSHGFKKTSAEEAAEDEEEEVSHLFLFYI